MNFLLKIDKKKRLLIASLQGETIKSILTLEEIQKFDSIIIKKGKSIYYKTDAVIEIFLTIGGVWSGAVIFKIFPKIFRNAIYDFIASNRYNWFGKRDQCRVPSEADKMRLLP